MQGPWYAHTTKKFKSGHLEKRKEAMKMGWARPSEVEEALERYLSERSAGRTHDEALALLPTLSRNHRKTFMTILRRDYRGSKKSGHGDQRDVATKKVHDDILKPALAEIRAIKRLAREELSGDELSPHDRNLLIDAYHAQPGRPLSCTRLHHADRVTAPIVATLENRRQDRDRVERDVGAVRRDALQEVRDTLEEAMHLPAAVVEKHMSYAERTLGIRDTEPPTISGWEGEPLPDPVQTIKFPHEKVYHRIYTTAVVLDGDDDECWRTGNPEAIAQHRSHRSGKRWSTLDLSARGGVSPELISWKLGAVLILVVGVVWLVMR
ncbi:MAG: hypothetical protein C7B46_19870 [Sulfobacillus benefaciens]|uniref:Uncharacterized protein n=1 Tax=Sulfobacillus benefaciens TaxID=453960 RepID=A0A2T2WWH9_9FIRM|nr:MAG: hypothetical protein C7B46_19870 [Sulfobacillus benefaciens]